MEAKNLRLKASQLILAKRADEAEGKLRKALQVLENAHRLPVVQADQERADTLVELALCLCEQRRYAEARDYLLLQQGIQEKADIGVNAKAQRLLARCALQSRSLQNEEDLLRKCAYLHDRATIFTHTDGRRAIAHHYLSLCLMMRGNAAEADQHMMIALEGFTRIAAATGRHWYSAAAEEAGETLLTEETFNGLTNMGIYFLHHDDIPRAHNWLCKSLDVMPVTYHNTGKHAEVLLQLGISSSDQGLFDDAEQYAREALSIRHKQQDVTKIQISSAMNHLGRYLTVQGKYKEAEEMLQQSLKETEGEWNDTRRSALLSLSRCLIEQNKTIQAMEIINMSKPTEAGDAFTRAIAMCRLALCTQMSQYRRDAVDDHMRVALGVAETCTKNQRAKIMFNVAEVLCLQGHWQKADRELEKALKIWETVQHYHPFMAKVLCRRGECFAALNDWNAAVKAFEMSGDVLDKCPQIHSEHPERGRVLLGWGRVLASQKAWASALSMLMKSIYILGKSLGAHPMTVASKGSPVEPTDILLKCLPENGPVAELKSSDRKGHVTRELQRENDLLKDEIGKLRKEQQQQTEEQQLQLASQISSLQKQLATAVHEGERQKQRSVKDSTDLIENLLNQLDEQRHVMDRQVLDERTRKEAMEAELKRVQDSLSSLQRDKTSTQAIMKEMERELNRYESVLEIPSQDVFISEIKLGEGSYGVVKAGQWHGANVAVKTFHQHLVNDRNRQLFRREMLLCAHIHHPSIVSVCGAIIDTKPYSFVMELLEASLEEVTSTTQLTLKEKIDIALGCLGGVSYLHSLRPTAILHGDIRPTNVFLTFTMEAKLGDLNTAHLVGDSFSVGPVSASYVAPERRQQQVRHIIHNTKEADVYSLGYTLAELFIGSKVDHDTRNRQIRPIEPLEVRDVCTRMVAETPDARMSCEEALITVRTVRAMEEYKQCRPKRVVKGVLKTRGNIQVTDS